MIGDRIKLLRTQAHLSQEEFGKIFNVSKQSVSGWENDESTPTIYTLKQMAEHFRVTSDFILELEDRNVISVEPLGDEEISHILLIINDFAKYCSNIKNTK